MGAQPLVGSHMPQAAAVSHWLVTDPRLSLLVQDQARRNCIGKPEESHSREEGFKKIDKQKTMSSKEGIVHQGVSRTILKMQA